MMIRPVSDTSNLPRAYHYVITNITCDSSGKDGLPALRWNNEFWHSGTFWDVYQTTRSPRDILQRKTVTTCEVAQQSKYKNILMNVNKYTVHFPHKRSMGVAGVLNIS